MVGELIAGRYELEEIVGSGGMATVYRAHDRLLERPVALKILHEQYSQDPDALERFGREARAVAQLAHPNIVTVIDRGEDGGRPYIVFEYVAGENLKQLVAREGPLPIATVIELGIQVARALEAAHDRGVVHRDVKPQNVLLADEGRAKVTDFGIARSLDVKHGVTQTGTVLGTSDYIAPEQAQGQPDDEHTDVDSLGIVLYELLTGEVPFRGDNFVAVAMQHINDVPPRVSERRPDVPPRVEAAVARALAKRPEDRFPTMAAFGAELEACLEELRSPGGDETMVLARPRPSVRRPAGPRRRTPLAAILVAIGLAVAVAALAIALLRDHGSSPGKPSGSGGGASVQLAGAGAYDPPPGDGEEHNADAPRATDSSTSTFWETQHYRSSFASLGKHGVGLVLRAGSTVTLHHLTVTTDTPGFSAEIQAGDSAGGPFRTVSAVQTVGAQTTFDLSDAKARYFVVWITSLGSLSVAHVNDVRAS